MANDGDEATMITWSDGKLETKEAGKTTGDDQVEGTVTICGVLVGTINEFDGAKNHD
jgi:hypothetical protein